MVDIKNEEDLLKNARTAKLQSVRGILLEVVTRSIKSVDSSVAIRKYVKVNGDLFRIGDQRLDLSKIRKIIVVGAGKASGAMAEAIEGILGDRIARGVVIVPHGTSHKYRTRKIKLTEAGHPLPTKNGKKSSERLITFLRGLSPQDLVICLISGGGSALLSLPLDDITVEELRETTQLLLKSGAPIQEVNVVRKHLSKVKGGQLARAAYPAKVISLLISDVVGDELDTIASGPTYPDPSTFENALSVLDKYSLSERVPESVLLHLKRGVKGEVSETPKPGEGCFRRVYHKIVASNNDALQAARRTGTSRGLNVLVLDAAMRGEARDVGARLALAAKKVSMKGGPVSPPALLLSGGETTVTVRGRGIGGRNQELVLSAATVIAGLKNVTIASFATDGIDGVTNAAGAVADGFTIERAKYLELDPATCLEQNDSYHFFEKLDDLLITGPTGTNVMDIACLLVI